MSAETTSAPNKRLPRHVEDAAAIDTMQALLIVLARDGKIRRTNRAFQRVLGYTAREVKGLVLWNTLLPPTHVNEFREALSKLQMRDDGFEFECPLLSTLGERPSFHWRGTAILSDTGGVQSYVLTAVPLAGLQSSTPFVPAQKKMEEIPGQEKRREKRRSYPYKQLIAPLVGEEMPSQDDFKPVSCHGISPGGFSFYVHGPPEYDKLIVAFGTRPILTYIQADVRHVTPVLQDGVQQFVVGCQFTGRVAY